VHNHLLLAAGNSRNSPLYGLKGEVEVSSTASSSMTLPPTLPRRTGPTGRHPALATSPSASPASSRDGEGGGAIGGAAGDEYGGSHDDSSSTLGHHQQHEQEQQQQQHRRRGRSIPAGAGRLRDEATQTSFDCNYAHHRHFHHHQRHNNNNNNNNNDEQQEQQRVKEEEGGKGRLVLLGGEEASADGNL
jgi:hypothetical protein